MVAEFAGYALFLVPTVNPAGVLIITITSMVGMTILGVASSKTPGMAAVDANISNKRATNIGNLLGQILIVGLLAIYSLVFLHNSDTALAGYALRIHEGGIWAPFYATAVTGTSTIIMVAQGITLLVHTLRRKKPQN